MGRPPGPSRDPLTGKAPLNPSASEGYVYADGHVHLYAEYDQVRFFRNGLQSARSFRAPLLLLLAETEGQSYFRLLRDHVDGRPQASAPASSVRPDVAGLEDLSLSTTGEPSSLAIDPHGSSDPAVFLICGRQFVSREKLEVLVFGLDPESELCSTRAEQSAAEDLIEQGLRVGAIVILPWGFGKWTGSRGRHVSRLADRAQFGQTPGFFLGDTPARCRPWPTPGSFRGPARVLPGTDVLPLPRFENRLATYGFRLRGHFDPDAPFGSLAGLLERNAPLEPFGRRDSLVRTVLNQVRLRLRRSDRDTTG